MLLKGENDMRFTIEDRRRKPKDVFGSGEFILWEVRDWPFPHCSFIAKFKTKKEATAKQRELEKEKKS